ncbi:hypothetical protein C0992_004358 [Termitomyces sp. T32_za158]|nr:hypothetical protein C0992_004358 [Termitomyces sp. T32_za158]
MHFMYPLLKGLVQYSDRPLFKDYVGSPDSPAWRTITYEGFLHDLEATALRFQQELRKLQLQPNNVVGLWITGKRYEDVVGLYALARAGFIPQIFSLVMGTQGGNMINDLLKVCNGKALIYDQYYQEHIPKIGFPTLPSPGLLPPANLQAQEHLVGLPVVEDHDVAIIFHTSGTTSGRPKPVPQSHKWLRYQWDSWHRAWQEDGPEQKVFSNIGSFANAASATLLNKVIPSGNCVIRTSKPEFDSAELLAMVKNEGLNNMYLYAGRMSRLLKVARTNIEVLKALRNMQQVSYTGDALNPDDICWITKQRLPIVAIYASTELSVSLVSDLRKPEKLPSMRPIQGSAIRLIPIPEDDPKYNKKLYDVFVPGDAPNCPHVSYRNRSDGHVSGDLFEETEPGYFAFRKFMNAFLGYPLIFADVGGRSDDWMKAGRNNMGLCDFKSIENKVLLECPDLVANCVVVGSSKPIVVLVEPTVVYAESSANPRLKAELIKRLESYQENLYPHERFEDRVVVVAPGSLPRTTDKGNIRRNAVEKIYADILGKIWSEIN